MTLSTTPRTTAWRGTEVTGTVAEREERSGPPFGTEGFGKDLLRELAISRPDHVWCADITYVPVTRGSCYLVAVMDWATRHVLSWRLSNTMDASFCVGALGDALVRATPDILNTNQGSQFTSEAFADRALAVGVRFSMDGRGRFLDDIFIERLWRSLKYEAVYLYELSDGVEAERIIGTWIDF